MAVAAVVWSEWATWRGSREAIPAERLDPHHTEPDETVLILGHSQAHADG